MSKLDTQNINVLSYNMNDVFVSASKDHYRFKASRDGKMPSIVPMPLSDIQYINSNTNVFLIGLLTFDDDEKEEIFKELRIPNWREILTNEEIESILVHPTLNGLQRIIEIDNSSYFDRVRVCMFKLMRDGVDITTKVKNVVDRRNTELQNRQRVSGIKLVERDIPTFATPNDVNDLKAQNASLQSQLDEMRLQMQKMMEMQKNNIQSKEETEDANDKSVIKTSTGTKKTGRSKKANAVT